MSITIGKRNYFESLDDPLIEKFANYSLEIRRPKFSSPKSDLDHIQLKKNAALVKLETLFPEKSREVLFIYLFI